MPVQRKRKDNLEERPYPLHCILCNSLLLRTCSENIRLHEYYTCKATALYEYTWISISFLFSPQTHTIG